MHHAWGPRISFNGQRQALDLMWFGPAFILLIPTAWIVTGTLWPESSTGGRLAGSAAAPVALIVANLVLAYLRSILANRNHHVRTSYRLGPLGGVNSSYRISEDPGSELRGEMKIIAAGAGIGLLLFALATPFAGIQSFHPLMVPGVVLTTFSLLQVFPAFPLAGGNIFRAIFWYLHDDHTTGTRAAFLYSQLAASGMLGFGIFFLLWRSDTVIAGFWGLFLGVLILRSSQHELLRSTIINRAEGVRAADALAGLNPTIRAAAPITEALDILLEQRSNGPALVRDRNVYIGMLNLDAVRDIPRARWPDLTAADVASPFDDLIDSEAGDDLLTIFRSLNESGGGTVIVREQDGEINGLVDSSMEPRFLLRRGIARTVPGLTDGASPQGDRRTS